MSGRSGQSRDRSPHGHRGTTRILSATVRGFGGCGRPGIRGFARRPPRSPNRPGLRGGMRVPTQSPRLASISRALDRFIRTDPSQGVMGGDLTMSSYWLGIDLGTTYTAAAICWPVPDGLEVRVVPLSNHSHAIPSVLFLPGDGSLVVGEGAQRRALTDPDRVVREFKSRIGDEIPMLVGGSPFFAHDLAAEFVVWLWQYVVEREGERPEGVALT